MRTKVTLVLLFLNVALFFFIFKFERPWRIEEKNLEARRRVLGAEAANIQSLKITYANATPAVSLTKRRDGWYLTEPFEWPANIFAVNSILNDLQFMEHEASWAVADLAKNNFSLADYGLDKPAITVTFTTSDPSTAKSAVSNVTLRLGDKAKDGNLLYLLSPDGTQVEVVRRSIADSLAQTLDQLRSNTLFSIPVYEVRLFALTTTAPASLRIYLRRDGNRWLFDAPIQTRANKTETELAINALNSLRVKAFVPAATADPSRVANPTLRISLEGNNRTETLVLYSAVPAQTGASIAPTNDVEYFARLEGKADGGAQMFTVVIPGDLRKVLEGAQTKLRERLLLDFDPRAVTAVTIAAPNLAGISLARDAAGIQSPTATKNLSSDLPWQLVRREGTQAPQTQPADSRIVQRLLEQLGRLSVKDPGPNTAEKQNLGQSASGFLSDAPTNEDLENWGFNRPERVVTLTIAVAPNVPPQTVKLELGVGAQRGTAVYARIAGSASVYEVDSEILRELPLQPLVYRDRLLRELPAGAQITHLTLTDTSTKSVIFDRAIAADAPRDDVVQKLIDQFRTLRAKAFVSDQFSATINVNGEDRPWKFQLDAAIALIGGAAGTQTSTTTLFLSDRVGGTTQYAGSPEFGATWEVEQPFLDAMWELAYGKRDPGPPVTILEPSPTPAPKP